MNCPYCDETVHAMAKFCPKCGLPMKDDATVMGAYVSDSDGPNWAMIGSGAAALVAIALVVGWLGTRHDSAAPDAGRLPTGWAANPVPFPAPASFQFSNVGYASASTGHSMSDEKPHWVWVPPAQPQMDLTQEASAALPPTQLLAMNPIALAHVRKPTYAYIPRPTVPDVPPMPAEVAAVQPSTISTVGYVLDNNPPSPPIEDASGNYVYDPVQERYALKGERRRMSGSTNSSRAVTGTIPPRGFVPGNYPQSYGPPSAPSPTAAPGTGPTPVNGGADTAQK